MFSKLLTLKMFVSAETAPKPANIVFRRVFVGGDVMWDRPTGITLSNFDEISLRKTSRYCLSHNEDCRLAEGPKVNAGCILDRADTGDWSSREGWFSLFRSTRTSEPNSGPDVYRNIVRAHG